MKWKHPPRIKVYEALGAVADNRVEISGDSGKVYSSSRNKFYDIIYNPETNAIMANDNGSYWVGYLGYPAIAFLMKIGVLHYNERWGELMKGIAWKDINVKFKNDFDKTLKLIIADFSKDEVSGIKEYVKEIENEIKGLDLNLLGEKTNPPDGY
uniref:Uncharacterized protein n=1 Tax=candidate division CPR3 bacterium TaxID=2268181 RepID=A0A7C4M0P2_UNCC3